MIELRPHAALGGGNYGWLKARRHFSFDDYYSAERLHWGNLRVWNDDTIAPKNGYPLHSHSDMEIITFVLSGTMTFQDSLGNLGRTEAGEVQVMSAGTGIQHAEYNLENDHARIFQIWILPEHLGGVPRWDKRPFPKAGGDGQFVELASGMGALSSREALPIRADARVLGLTLEAGGGAGYRLAPSRHAYLVPASGAVKIGDVVAREGDGVAMKDLEEFRVVALEKSELLLVDTA